jgi:lipopolysaccharide/colanic/teichoic acid biosynthesis glycosyltransferase
MDKGQVSASSSQPLQAFFIASLGLVAVLWIYLQSPRASLIGISLFAVHALLAFTLGRALTTVSLRKDWGYRVAFFLPIGLYLADLIWRFTSPQPGFGWVGLVLVVWGAFLGAFLATSLNGSLWEDNSPPSERIQAKIYQDHQEIIGTPGREPLLKRAFDVCFALLGLVLFAPVWLLAAFLIWIEDPGPLFFVKNSVGKGGINFHQYKFRTMVHGAESGTGPVLSSDEDERVLVVGRLLRKTALDELPQLINILRGEMSFVGPRPQRTVLVLGYLEGMPEYAERHRVLPGLAGLAQVAGDYYLTPRQKLRFDRLYIRHRSLGFDLKLILMAFTIAFWFRWQKNWNGRLPRKWFR